MDEATAYKWGQVFRILGGALERNELEGGLMHAMRRAGEQNLTLDFEFWRRLVIMVAGRSALRELVRNYLASPASSARPFRKSEEYNQFMEWLKANS